MRKLQIKNYEYKNGLPFHSPLTKGGYRGVLIVLFTVSCLLFTAHFAHSQGLVVMANKVSGELPLDPENSQWNSASPIEIPLSPQVMSIPRIYKSELNRIKVKALHNTKEIAFMLEWSDDTEDASSDINKFSDAVALQFPASSATAKPHFAMGDKENTVNIWLWKALWQNTEGIEKTYAMTDDFAGGIEVGNPVSKPRTSPAENIIAQGFGSATDMEKADTQDLGADGKWRSNRWGVVFKRYISSRDKYDVSFSEGRVTPVAFAVWNGSEANRGARKAVSTWYYVGLETEEKKTIYAYPVIAFFGAAGIEALIILGLRKRRKA